MQRRLLSAGFSRRAYFFLSHVRQRLKVSYCDHWMSVVRFASPCGDNNCSKEHLCWLFTKPGRKNSYMALFYNCSNGFSPSHILDTQAKNRFSRRYFVLTLTFGPSHGVNVHFLFSKISHLAYQFNGNEARTPCK